MTIPKQQVFVNVVVAIGESLSAAVDLEGRRIVGFIAPAAIEATTTNVSFAAAPTLTGTYNVVKPDGVKLTLPFAVNDYFLFATTQLFFGVRFVKLQMETGAGAAVAQATAARTFTLILETF